MPIGLNDAEPQKTFEVIPDGTFVKLLLQIKPGGYTLPGGEVADAKLFRQPKSADAAVTMEIELTVMEGTYIHRKWTEYWTVAGGALDEKGHSKGWNITKTRLRAAIESNQGLRSDDASPQAVAARQINNFAELNNVWFYAKVGIDPAEPYNDPMTGEIKPGFDKNRLDRIVTADMVEYADLVAGKPVEAKPAHRRAKPAAAGEPVVPARNWGGPPQTAKPAELPLGGAGNAQTATTAPAATPSWLRKA